MVAIETSVAIDVSSRLTREAGILAGRLARFLNASFPHIDQPLADGHAFLQAFFESVAEGQSLDWWLEHSQERRPVQLIHPLDRITRRLALTPVEIDLLLLAGLSEEHEGLAAVLRTLHPRNEPYPTVGLAAQLICDGSFSRDALRETLGAGALVRSGALRLSSDAPIFEQSFQLCDSLWTVLHGIDVWPGMVSLADGRIVSAGLEEWFETPGARRAIEAIRQHVACTVAVTADNEEAAFSRALAMVAHAGAQPQGFFFRPLNGFALDRLLALHALARDVVPVLRMTASDGPTVDETHYFADFPGVVIACGPAKAICKVGLRPLINMNLERMSPAARQRMWSRAIPSMSTEAAFLAARYPVEPCVAAEVATDVEAAVQLEDRPPVIEDVAASIRARSNISLAAGIRLIDPRASWDNLVLPADRLGQLREAVSRLEQQGRVFDEWGFLRERTGARGVRLLFTGPPGTGKTLSAEVLANTLKVDLLVVDLSRVVSKWIGETEKNLAAVFDAAERGKAALFFDEADALFGKRTEVIDAHDRYANLETAYLLTRLEQFEGLAILATNFRQNIDAAFLRRLEFVIDFQEPDREERVSLWRCHLPPEVPMAPDVNLYELAALYPVVGGVIRNAAVAAGFLAARDGVPLGRPHFVHAIRREYAKAGRSFPGAPIDLVVQQ
jgi:SpoVK/Ycf46/Vps4 family AAA+-type ATPase